MDAVSTIPTFDEVQLLPIEVARTVPSSFEDVNGHMNIRHYFDLQVAGVEKIFDRLGIDDDYRHKRGLGIFTIEHHLKYLAETSAGDEVTVHTRLLERSDKIFHGIGFLVNVTRRELANTFEFSTAHVNMATRRVTPFDADMAAAADREIAVSDSASWPAPVIAAMGVRR